MRPLFAQVVRKASLKGNITPRKPRRRSFTAHVQGVDFQNSSKCVP